MTIYDYPEYYEAAFSFRDIQAEAMFIDQCIKKYSDIPVKSVFEVACGSAPHAKELVSKGYEYVGLDINRNMLDHAMYQNKNLNPAPKLIEADMSNFRLEQKIDFAYVMLGSLYLDSQKGMSAHFDSLSRSLKTGGLYFLDWCIQFADPMAPDARNTVFNEANGINVESKFNIRLIDPAEQMYEEIWTVKINDNGRHKKFEMIERNRAIFPQEFLLFIENRTDFEFVGWWRDWDFNQPITGNSAIARPIALIKKI